MKVKGLWATCIIFPECVFCWDIHNKSVADSAKSSKQPSCHLRYCNINDTWCCQQLSTCIIIDSCQSGKKHLYILILFSATTSQVEVGCLRHPAAFTSGIQLLDGDCSHCQQITRPSCELHPESRQPSHWQTVEGKGKSSKLNTTPSLKKRPCSRQTHFGPWARGILLHAHL